MRTIVPPLVAVAILLVPALLPGQDAPFRPPVEFTDDRSPPPLPPEVNDDRRVVRNYPEQPPVIPHSVRDYQINLNTNRCLTCHSRQFTEAVQAPMISITHYVNRDGQTLALVAPRRYFCLQCHVPQTTVDPVVENRFQDVIDLIERRTGEDGGQ